MAKAEQMGFGFEKIEEEKATAHLPSEMEAGIAVYRSMLEQHNQAMLDGNEAAAMAIRKEAHRLAEKLNGGVGLLAGPEASGCRLMDGTAAVPRTVPMWGQQGSFDIKVGDTPVHIEMDGMLGISESMSIWPGFSANVIEPDKPFFSETGYSSQLLH
jgi:hypothetical protein